MRCLDVEVVVRARGQSLGWTSAVLPLALCVPMATLHAAPTPPAHAPEQAGLWPGQDKVSIEALYAELGQVADEIATSPAVRADYEALLTEYGLTDTAELYRDYVRVKVAFEATRDGGWWHLSWKITNEKPNSEEIWKQWKQTPTTDATAPRPSALAECDELSALFAFSARRMGVRGIGLYWPTWNHVVAVWTVQSADGTSVRIVVPTSQIFLSDSDSLGTRGFNPWSQKTIYEYRRRDVKKTHRIDAKLARFFVQQAARHGAKSQAILQDERNQRDARLMAALESPADR
ncbi:MAG: hypothetical protein JKY37_16665 [Nannocystaceae bacterium]|nr:hypothetical protein [Nannocystaceae bacterium]